MDNNNNNANNLLMMNLINIIQILSFILQVENNEELAQQSTNDEVIENLHHDIVNLLQDNRDLFDIVIKQNDEILDILKGDK